MDTKELKESVNRLVDAMIQKKAAEDLMKTILSDAEELGQDKKRVKQLATLKYKDAFPEFKEDAEETIELYEELFGEDD